MGSDTLMSMERSLPGIREFHFGKLRLLKVVRAGDVFDTTKTGCGDLNCGRMIPQFS